MSDQHDTAAKAASHNYIYAIIEQDVANNTHNGKVVTRFPPEPNGFLHIGHAKSICLNFGLAKAFGGQCHLRFDDTNPAKEEQQYIDAIQEDVRWLGFEWAGAVRYSSDYFQQLYAWAVHLIEQGHAYVCQLSAEQASEYRGWATKPGRPSPYRDNSVAENLALFEHMKNGELEDGAAVLRAKIDMASPNMNMRDPILYRIRHQTHHQTGDKWCIYPSYDFAHGQGDAIEGVTHSICTLEFQDHRPLYDWLLEHLPVPARPRQYEFGRLNLNYTVTSKRKLKQLVDENVVHGWDDPRMPTLAGMRRRGYTPQSIRDFCDGLAVAKTDGTVDMAQLEFAVRNDMNNTAPRAMCVLEPVKLRISNFATLGDEVKWLEVPNHPNDDSMGSRKLPFTQELYIERSDFSEDTSLSRKKFKRLVLGEYVRLRGAWVIRADDVVHDAQGNVQEIIASLVPDTLGESPPEGIKPRGVIHWVSASHGKQVQVRLYERLFVAENPDKHEDGFLAAVNPQSLQLLDNCWMEPDAAVCAPESRFQFERVGYFASDNRDHSAQTPVFNKTIGLKEGN